MDIEIDENYQLFNCGKNYRFYMKKIKNYNTLQKENDTFLGKIELLNDKEEIIFEQEMMTGNVHIKAHDNNILEVNLLNSLYILIQIILRFQECGILQLVIMEFPTYLIILEVKLYF